jgi:hypothetical protein
VVPALVNPVDRSSAHYWQLGNPKNCLGNSSHCHADFGVVDLLFVTLA